MLLTLKLLYSFFYIPNTLINILQVPKDKEYGGLAAVIDSTVEPITNIISSFLEKALYL